MPQEYIYVQAREDAEGNRIVRRKTEYAKPCFAESGKKSRASGKEENSSEARRRILSEFARCVDGIDYDDFAHSTARAKDTIQEAKELGIVIVYGMSDDLLEFDGAFREEAGCWVPPEKKTAEVTFDRSGTSDDGKKHRNTIIVHWCDNTFGDMVNGEDFCWKYETDIPHETFRMYSDEDRYCLGMVFFETDMK